MNRFVPFFIRRKRSFLIMLAVLAAVFGLAGTLSQTVFAENTYMITDGNAVTIYTTHASDPVKVLQEAGVILSADDTYTTGSVDGVSEIRVQRAQTITVYNGDEVLHANSYGETLETLFVRLGIAMDSSVQVSAPLTTMTYDGMVVRVNRVVKYIESYTVGIPFETVYCEDPTLAKGVEKVLVQGTTGQLLCTANVVYVNAQESSRVVYQQTVIEEPVKQVIAVGTGEQVGQPSDKPLIGDGIIVLPTGEVLTYTHTDQFVATAYTKTDAGCNEITANGAHVKWGVVAIDPKVVPYGTRMFIVSNDGAYIYGLSTAEDCGGAIKNKRLDLYMDSYWECMQFGVRKCTVYFLGDANWRENGYF